MGAKLIFSPNKVDIKKFCDCIVHMQTMLAVLLTRNDIVGLPASSMSGHHQRIALQI